MIGRFVPFVRTYITVVAGVTRMDRRRFAFWSLVGAVMWVLVVLFAGYFLGAAFPTLGENIDKAVLVILAFSVVPIVFEWWRHKRQGGDDAETGTEAAEVVEQPAAPAVVDPAPASRTAEG